MESRLLHRCHCCWCGGPPPLGWPPLAGLPPPKVACNEVGSLMESCVCHRGEPPLAGWPPHVMDGWGARPLRWLSVLVKKSAAGCVSLRGVQHLVLAPRGLAHVGLLLYLMRSGVMHLSVLVFGSLWLNQGIANWRETPVAFAAHIEIPPPRQWVPFWWRGGGCHTDDGEVLFKLEGLTPIVNKGQNQQHPSGWVCSTTETGNRNLQWWKYMPLLLTYKCFSLSAMD